MKTLPIVWYVDDLQSNLDKFADGHKRAFHVERFTRPQEILDALGTRRPDALLCDVFFYDSESQSKEMEDKVQEAAMELQKTAHSIGADAEKYQAGITLIEQVFSRYGGKPPFPVYAYTSKGPYILDGAAFDRIDGCGARWLFKGRSCLATEELVINRDIRVIGFTKYLPWWLQTVWRLALASGVVGAVLVTCLFEAGKFLIHMLWRTIG